MPIQITPIVSEMFSQNAYLVRSGPGDCVVIDPGLDSAALLRAVELEGATVAAILLTHGHMDHIAGVRAVKTAFPDAPILIGERDAPMLPDAVLNLSELFGVPITAPPADGVLSEGEVVTFAGFSFEVFDLPGHSPGHVVFKVVGEPHLFGGDVLFAGSIGRTDFPGGSQAELVAGIRAKLWPMPGETVVYPGHGPATTIGQERETNPFR